MRPSRHRRIRRTTTLEKSMLQPRPDSDSPVQQLPAWFLYCTAQWVSAGASWGDSVGAWTEVRRSHAVPTRTMMDGLWQIGASEVVVHPPDDRLFQCLPTARRNILAYVMQGFHDFVWADVQGICQLANTPTGMRILRGKFVLEGHVVPSDWRAGDHRTIRV